MLGLFSGKLIFGGAYYWKEFCVSKWVGLDNKNSLKHEDNREKQLNTASGNSPWVYGSGGLIIGRIFASEIWEAYFREGLFIYLFIYFFFWGGGRGGLVIGILRYFVLDAPSGRTQSEKYLGNHSRNLVNVESLYAHPFNDSMSVFQS